MEKELRDTERMLSSIVENTWGFVYRCRNEKDWPMDFVSQRIRDYTGYTPKEFITGHVHYGSLIHPDDSEPVWNEVQRAVEVQGSYDMEYRLLSRTGKQKWVWDRGAGVYDTNGNLVALEGIVVDITERKKVEQALRDSEERFNKAFHTSPDFIIITSVDEGKIVEVNRACTGISGYTRKELIGRSILELDLPAYPEDRERYINVMKKKGRVVDMDTGLRRKDGEICEVLMSGALIELSGKQHVLTIVKDITERKQAEQALLDSEDKFNKAFHASPDCMALLSLANGRITEANEACSRLTAYTREELITNSVLELGIFKDPEAWERYIVILQDDCRIVDMEAEVCRKDGDIRQVILSMDQIVLSGERYILVISKDITERKKIEDKLQTSEFRFRQMFENISSGVAVYEAINDGDGFIFRDFNSAAERIENKGRKEVIGRSVQEVFPAIKEFGLFEVFQRVWRTGKAEYFPVTFYRDSRTSGWRENYVYKLPSGEIVAVYDDITERKQTEEKLKESEARFYKAFNSNPDVVSITTLGNSVFIEVNDSFTRVFGYTRDEVIGRSSLELGLWADEKDRKAVVNEFREQGITENKEIAFRTKTGELRTMLVSTDIIGI
ncbi:MAG: PAS domain S-box protein, partial [Dehalococcoidia bacterium]